MRDVTVVLGVVIRIILAPWGPIDSALFGVSLSFNPVMVPAKGTTVPLCGKNHISQTTYQINKFFYIFVKLNK